MNERGMVFLNQCGDHHTIGLMQAEAGSEADHPAGDQLGLSHFAMEVGSLDELFEIREFLHGRGIPLEFQGRKGGGAGGGGLRPASATNVGHPRVSSLEGKRVLATAPAPCVFGNLKHSLELGGADLGQGGVPDCSLPMIHNATMCANGEWAKANEETTIAFLKSMIDAIHFFKTRPDRSCEIIERELAPLIGLQNADEVRHLHRVWADLLSSKPFPHPLAVWNVYNLDVAHDPNVNFIGPFEIWNTSYLRAIDDSGFIDELYGGAEGARNPEVNAAI